MAEENKTTDLSYSNRIYIWLVLGAVALVVFDQLMKYVAVLTLKGKPARVLIDNVLELRYLENQGAAFGILQNRQFVFTIITVVFIVISLYALVRVPKTRYYLRLIVACTFLFAGAIGNFIDRVVHQYVVDFIYFSIIDFPIFNVADIYVTLSVIAIGIMILFRYKDNDFAFLKRSRGKKNEGTEDQH